MQLAEFDIDYILLTNGCERDYITGKFTCIEGKCHTKDISSLSAEVFKFFFRLF